MTAPSCLHKGKSAFLQGGYNFQELYPAEKQSQREEAFARATVALSFGHPSNSRTLAVALLKAASHPTLPAPVVAGATRRFSAVPKGYDPSRAHFFAVRARGSDGHQNVLS